MRLKTGLGGVFAVALLAADQAGAADLGYPTAFGAPAAPIAQAPVSFLSEVRLGTFAHDPASPEKGSADLNGEVLFAKPFSEPGSPWDFLFPRP
ncbi:MAG: acyloxyacyl hydrolase, partial [Hyphomicrobiales bacterium]|nr:acyloxyacyl hydrolase [Hyphomicrobiales bacterium]